MAESQTISEAEAKRKLIDLISRAHDRMERFILTRKGKPEAVLMSYEEYEEYLETEELLSNPKKVREIKETFEKMEKGEYYTYEEVFGKPQPKKWPIYKYPPLDLLNRLE